MKTKLVLITTKTNLIDKKSIASHRITLHRISSRYTILHHITSYSTSSQHSKLHHIAFYNITLHRLTTHHITAHCITSDHITSHRITSHRRRKQIKFEYKSSSGHTLSEQHQIECTLLMRIVRCASYQTALQNSYYRMDGLSFCCSANKLILCFILS